MHSRTDHYASEGTSIHSIKTSLFKIKHATFRMLNKYHLTLTRDYSDGGAGGV